MICFLFSSSANLAPTTELFAEPPPERKPIILLLLAIIAKSNRIMGFLSGGGSANSSVVGARFADEEKRKHIITHYVSNEVIKDTVEKLQHCIKLLDEEFNGAITCL